MSLHYRCDLNDCNVTKLPLSVRNDVKLSTSLHNLTSHEAQRARAASLAGQWLKKRIRFRIVSLFSHHTVESMFKAPLRFPTPTLTTVEHGPHRMA